MHPVVYAEFRSIVSALGIKGRVLEIGAIASSLSLLAMDLLKGEERVGVDLRGNVRFQDFDIIEANANDLSMFETGHFDLVLSNATLEHDRFFWKTCAEIRRVLRVGGAAVVGVPAFTIEAGTERLALPAPWADDDEKSWSRCALTFRYHGAPDDYYRFSPSAVRDVFFEGYRDVATRVLMIPPRIIGYGFKV